MDWQYLLFNPNGRIGQGDFWRGVAVLVLANLLVHVIPLLGGLIWLVLIWVGIAVYGKRLHDAGRSALWHAVPWLVGLVAWGFAMVVLGGAILTAVFSDGDVSPWAMISAGGSLLGVLGLTNLVWLVYTLWVGLAVGDSGDNVYGAAPAINASAVERE